MQRCHREHIKGYHYIVHTGDVDQRNKNASYAGCHYPSQVHPRRVEGNGIQQLLFLHQLWHHGLSCRSVEDESNAGQKRSRHQMPELNGTEGYQDGNYQRDGAKKDVGGYENPPLVQSIGNSAAKHGEKQDGNTKTSADQSQGKGRVGHLVNQPTPSHYLHLQGGEGRYRSEPVPPIVTER